MVAKINHSTQVEGAFGVLKKDYGFCQIRYLKSNEWVNITGGNRRNHNDSSFSV